MKEIKEGHPPAEKENSKAGLRLAYGSMVFRFFCNSAGNNPLLFIYEERYVRGCSS